MASCPRSALAVVGTCFALAAAFSLALGTVGCLATTVSLLASTVYSVGPRLKALPGIGTLLNAVIFAPLLALGASSALPPGFGVLASSFGALLLQNQILHEQADLHEDAAAGTYTTARALGPRARSVIVGALAALGFAGACVWAPSKASRVVACIVIGAGSAWAVGLGQGRVADCRRVHRWLSFAGGAMIYVATAAGAAA